MTEQNINIKIARFMGYEYEGGFLTKGGNMWLANECTNYCNDLNEVWEVEEKLKEKRLQGKYNIVLIDVLVSSHGKWNNFIIRHATAKECCEAIVKVIEGSE